MSLRVKEYERLAKQEIPIFTKFRPGPNGEVDCRIKVMSKMNKRKVLIAVLILKERDQLKA